MMAKSEIKLNMVRSDAYIQQLIAHRNDVLGYLKNLGQGLTQKDKSVELFEDTVLLTLIDLVKSVNSKGVVKLELEELFKR